MPPDVVEFHRRATEWFGSNVVLVGDDQWHGPTPCTEWDVRALVNHLVYESAWVAPLLEGATIEEVGDRFDGDLLGDDPKGAWDKTASSALHATQAVAMDRIVHLSYGDVPASDYVFEVATDHLIHGWDLARAIGASERLDDDLVDLVYERTRPRVRDLKASGLFGPDVTPPPDADRQTELLAMFGRVA